MKPFRVAIYDSTWAVNALHHAGIACEAVRWGDVVYLEVKRGDVATARQVLQPWLLPTWWQHMWLWLRGKR